MPKNRSSAQNIDETRRERWGKKKHSMRFYNIIFARYDELYAIEQDIKYNLILRSFRKNSLKMVLDIGCGSGLFLEKIINISKMRVGIDFSQKMLTNAKKINALTHYICADADYLPLRERVFDSVFAFTVIQNIPDPKSTLLEMIRVAKRESFFGITFPNNVNLDEKVLNWFKDVGMSSQEMVNDTGLKDRVFICRIE